MGSIDGVTGRFRLGLRGFILSVAIDTHSGQGELRGVETRTNLGSFTRSIVHRQFRVLRPGTPALRLAIHVTFVKVQLVTTGPESHGDDATLKNLPMTITA